MGERTRGDVTASGTQGPDGRPRVRQKDLPVLAWLDEAHEGALPDVSVGEAPVDLRGAEGAVELLRALHGATSKPTVLGWPQTKRILRVVPPRGKSRPSVPPPTGTFAKPALPARSEPVGVPKSTGFVVDTPIHITTPRLVKRPLSGGEPTPLDGHRALALVQQAGLGLEQALPGATALSPADADAGARQVDTADEARVLAALQDLPEPDLLLVAYRCDGGDTLLERGSMPCSTAAVRVTMADGELDYFGLELLDQEATSTEAASPTQRVDSQLSFDAMQRGPEVSLGQQAVQHFEVRPDALHKCRVVNGPAVSLAEGQAVLRVEQFALTSNNVTYGLVGREMGYFDLFPARPGWGCLPAWGFSRVIESRRTDLPEGEILFGFVPMATHWRMSVGDVEPHAVTAASAHRQAFLPVYNTYWRLSESPLYQQEQQALWSLYWPLFMTGFSMAAELEDARPPADAQVVISSASSKTALCLASALRSLRRERKIVGLTSPRNAAFVRDTGLYDAVFSYEEVDQLEQRSSYFVDVAGHAQTLAAVHRQLHEQLVQSWMLGATNWHSFHGLAPDPALPGPTPAFFFAPEHMAKRFAQWGLDGYMDRFAPAWMRFLTSASALVQVRQVEGERGLLAAYLQAFGGKLDPAEGLVVRL